LESGASKRTVKIDDEKQRGANVLAEYVSAIWLTPQMDGIFLESNSDRRRFFDRIIYNFDPEHASRVAVYENATSERLRLLKNGSADQIWLRTLEKRMAEYGIAIAAARNEVIGYLQDFLNAGATNFPKPIIEIRGKYEFLLHEYSALEVEQIFLSDLAESRAQDAANGRTAFGVHKTDFYVINAIKNIPAYLSSTGEQKALLLSIILGLARLLKARKNKTPIVLLDEVIAHLDENRRQELYDEIKNLGCQTFLTGTEKSVFSGISEAAFYEVKNSFVTPCFA
jgi:DNA replication and repair protein RecF